MAPDPCQPPEQGFPDIRTRSKRDPRENLHHRRALLGVCRVLGDKRWTNIICKGGEDAGCSCGMRDAVVGCGMQLWDAGQSLANGCVRTGIVSNAERVHGAQTEAGWLSGLPNNVRAPQGFL